MLGRKFYPYGNGKGVRGKISCGHAKRGGGTTSFVVVLTQGWGCNIFQNQDFPIL